MKFIKILLVIISLLVVGVLALGYFNPVQNSKSEVLIDAPVEQTFRIANNPFLLDKWLINLSSIENVKGKQGEIGSQWLLKFDEDGKKVELLETVTAWETNKLFAFDYDAEPMTGSSKIEFIDENGKTRVVGTNEYRGKNILWNAMLVMSSGIIQERNDQQFENLKTLVESAEPT